MRMRGRKGFFIKQIETTLILLSGIETEIVYIIPFQQKIMRGLLNNLDEPS